MVFRALGWILLAMAVAVVVHDALSWWTGGALQLMGLGDLWSLLDVRSLNDAQAATQRYLSADLWNWTVVPVLLVPALLAFLVLGLLFLWLGNRGGSEGDFLGGSRPPRRRRSRGGLS